MCTARVTLSFTRKPDDTASEKQGNIKDVVRAYKGLQKEKEALETSLTTLTSGHIKETHEGIEEKGALNVPNTKKSGHSSSQEDVNDDAIQENTEEGKEISVEDLQKKLTTLTLAMTTLNAEKKRIETSFQSDKKRLLAEKEKLEISLTEAIESKVAAERNAEEKIQDLRSRLIIGQHEREQEIQKSQVMLRFCQTRFVARRPLKDIDIAMDDL
ncbi:unnamed protein product, partial [Meganyctiphanes norvegica]